jgi:predicted exporter
MRRIISTVVLALVMSAGRAALAEEQKTFLVTTTHTPQQCLSALDEMAQKNEKLLSTMEWGCKSGDHTGYAFVSARSEQEALAKLPEANRATAKAVPVTKFTPKQLKKIHADMDAAKK